MGSSAAMTTALVGSLLQWFDIIRLGSRCGEDDRRILLNLAQLSHGIAQGKIGSGFDVAAAVYGKQYHIRFIRYSTLAYALKLQFHDFLSLLLLLFVCLFVCLFV